MRMRGMMGQGRHCNERDALLLPYRRGGQARTTAFVCARQRKEKWACSVKGIYESRGHVVGNRCIESPHDEHDKVFRALCTRFESL